MEESVHVSPLCHVLFLVVFLRGGSVNIIQEFLGAFNICPNKIIDDLFSDIGVSSFDDDTSPVTTVWTPIFGWSNSHGASNVIPGFSAPDSGGFTLGTYADGDEFTFLFEVTKHLYELSNDFFAGMYLRR
jgi:hypothetical protein